jgi:hypothetical protein
MLLEGEGAPRDPARALAWFLRAARAGAPQAPDPEAMNMVGRCLDMGWGCAADAAAAADWYRRAAEAGDAWGQYNWANMLFDGRGVGEDRSAAVRWYARAARQGHARAMNLLARCCEEGWGVFADRAAAARWYRLSAEAGYFRAQFNHATLLFAERRLDEAVAWFENAFAAAPAQDRPAMADLLVRHGDARLAALGARLAETSDSAPAPVPAPEAAPKAAAVP